MKSQRTSENGNIREVLCLFLFVLSVFFFFSCGDDGFNTAFKSESGDSFPSPGNSGVLSASYLNSLSFVINWQKASDDNTPSSKLQYRVFASSTAFSSYSEAVSSADELTAGWTLDISSLQCTVPSGRNYQWCNVFVRDENDNVAAYAGAVPVLFTDRAPEPGGGGSISVTSSQPLNVSLTFEKGSDNQTPQSLLRYRAYYSTARENIDTFEHADSLGIQLTGGWVYDISNVQSAIASGGTFWFNVFVMDDLGFINAYTPVQGSVGINTAPAVPLNSQLTAVLNADYTESLSWIKADDDYTQSAMLRYRVFLSTVNTGMSYADYFDVSGNALVYELTLGWTSDISSALTPVLNRSTVYYCNVFVCDSDGLISAYPTCIITVPSSMLTPGNTGQIFLSDGNATTNLTLSWTAASDDFTAQSKLQYRVFSATSASAFPADSLPVTNFSSAEATSGWTENITKTIVPLTLLTSSSSLLYYNVYVKNYDGTIKAYNPVYNAAAPQPGNSGIISAVSQGAKKVRLSWTAASDSSTPQSGLLYCIYSSEVSDLYDAPTVLSSYQSAVAGASGLAATAVLEMDWTADITAFTPKMSKNATYYFNVFVKDPGENYSAYVPVSAVTGD